MTGTVTVLPPGTGGRVLDFRRRGAPPRRKRKSPLVKLLKPLAVAVGLVALPAGLVAWVLTAPLFQLREVDVRRVQGAPAGRVSPDQVRQSSPSSSSSSSSSGSFCSSAGASDGFSGGAGGCQPVCGAAGVTCSVGDSGSAGGCSA